MTDRSSLFAEKLRSYRASSGVHGRMTQEELAQLLDVSVDAISKYERSLSFIRGDLEHRLSEKLGWNRDEIVACREDWESRAHRLENEYRVFREYDVAPVFGSIEDAWDAVQDLIGAGEPDFPDGFPADAPIWPETLRDGSMSCIFVTQGGNLVGHLQMIFLNEALEKRFHERCLVESEFSLNALRRPVIPGDYFGYVAGAYIAREHQKAALPLLSGFVGILEDFIEREVFLREMGAVAASPIGHQLCEDLGFHHTGPHVDNAALEFWHFPGREIPGSLLARRSPEVRRAYLDHFGRDRDTAS